MRYKGDYQNKFYLAIQEIGAANFKIEIIDKATTIDELNEKEMFWIKELNTMEAGYNMMPGGGCRLKSSRVKHVVKEKDDSKIRLSDLDLVARFKLDQIAADISISKIKTIAFLIDNYQGTQTSQEPQPITIILPVEKIKSSPTKTVKSISTKAELWAQMVAESKAV